jgi:hypothetical protein
MISILTSGASAATVSLSADEAHQTRLLARASRNSICL